MATLLSDTIPIKISEDHLQATLIMAKADPEHFTEEEINECLKERGIAVNEFVRDRIQELLELKKEGALPREPFRMAEGRLPEPGVAASIELAWPESEQDEEDDHTDFYRSQILTVKAGEAFGTYTPEVPAVHGIDVFGEQIPAEEPNSVEIGENVTLSEDGTALIASVDGQVRHTDNIVSIIEVVEIESDIDYETGNIESPTNIVINGTVRDTFSVKSQKNISVRGAIEAASIEVGGDLQVLGGVAAHSQGSILAKGEIHAKFCSEANIKAKGNITIARECMNSQVHTRGYLTVPRGKVVGGFTYARQGAEIKVLGNEAERKTKIAIGLDPNALLAAKKIDEIVKKKRQQSEAIREKAEPLMTNIKRLTPEQREQATQLLSQADSIDDEAEKLEDKKKKILEANGPSGRIMLNIVTIIYPGVTVIIGNKMATLRQERRGPVRIERRKVERVDEICIVEQCSGSVTVLPSYEYDPEAPDEDEDE